MMRINRIKKNLFFLYIITENQIVTVNRKIKFFSYISHRNIIFVFKSTFVFKSNYIDSVYHLLSITPYGNYYILILISLLCKK